MKAIWDEARRAHRMEFSGGLARTFFRGRTGGGWFSDPHLRKGWFCGAIVFLPAALYAMRTFSHDRSFSPLFLAVVVPAALLSNVVWFAVAAWSRARS